MDGWMWDGGRVVLVLLRWQSPWGPRPERRILTISEHNQEQHASSFAILILHLTETNPASVITPIHSPVLVGCMMFWWCPSGVMICSGASRTAAWSSWTSWRSSTCRGWALVKLLLVTGVQELLCTLLRWPGGGGTGQRSEKTGSGFIEQDKMLRLTK